MDTPQKPPPPPSNSPPSGEHNDFAIASAQLGRDLGCVGGLAQLFLWLVFLSVQLGRAVAYGWAVPLLRRDFGGGVLLIYGWFGTAVLWMIKDRFTPGAPMITAHVWYWLLIAGCTLHTVIVLRRPATRRVHSMDVGVSSWLTCWLFDRLPGGRRPLVTGLVYEPLLLLGLTYGLAVFDDPGWRSDLKRDLRFPAAMIPCLACIAVFTQSLVMWARQSRQVRVLRNSEAQQRAQGDALGTRHASGTERSADGRVRLADILPARRGGAR